VRVSDGAGLGGMEQLNDLACRTVLSKPSQQAPICQASTYDMLSLFGIQISVQKWNVLTLGWSMGNPSGHTRHRALLSREKNKVDRFRSRENCDKPMEI
jgi:hypothetical protein